MAEQNPNQEELRELRKEIFQRQLMELSIAPGVTWSSSEPFKLNTTIENGGATYNMWLSKTSIGGSRDYQYTLDVIKNGSPFISTSEGESVLGDRSTYVRTLFEQVEKDIMEMDKNQKEATQLLMDTANCR